MSRRIAAALVARITDIDVVQPPPPSDLTFTDRIAILQAQGVTVHRWGRSVNTSGTTYTMQIGANGTIVNPKVGDYDQGALLEDSNGGSSIGLSGAFPNPTYIEVATVEQATWEFTVFLQFDQAFTYRVTAMQINSGADLAGGAECKFSPDGSGGMSFRFESADSTPSRVIKEGSTTGQVPVGETVMASFVRTAADLECYTNGQPRTLTLLSGTLATWPAPVAGTTYLGAFVSGGNSSNGVDALLGEWLITSPLTADQRAFLAAHAKQDRVIALDLDVGEINEDDAAETYPVIHDVHPANGTLAISTAPSVGSAEVGNNVIVYDPASVASDTPVTIGYTNTYGGVTSAEATLSIMVRNQSAPPGPSTLAEDAPLPTPLNIENGTTATFNGLLDSGGSAQPGDRIMLANGSYGSRTIARSGTQANPIQVVATTQFGPVCTSLKITGSWVIVSGVDINAGTSVSTGHRLRTEGSNIRFTRGKVRNGGYLLVVGAGATDILVDHTQFHRSGDRMFYCDDPLNQQRITVARCWCHELLNAGAIPSNSLMFAWADENIYREKNPRVVVRLCYIGPGTAPGATATDFIHQKSSGSLYAFNRLEGGVFVSFRNGMNSRMVGCYFPGSPMNVWDDGHWLFGNVLGDVKCPAGISAYYDTTKSLITSNQGGFPPTTRFRAAGNQMAALRLGWDFGNNTFCTRSDGPLPDAQPAGVAKPARSWLGVNYAAMPAGDGLSIRAHSGTISTDTGMTCLSPQAVNISSLPGTAAPASWLNDLVAQYPWIDDICPNPTSLTGGPGGSAPWSVAQALTRGDAATPNTGPLRNSPGGRV